MNVESTHVAASLHQHPTREPQAHTAWANGLVFRTEYDRHASDPAYVELIDELSGRNPALRVWWAEHAVRPLEPTLKHSATRSWARSDSCRRNRAWPQLVPVPADPDSGRRSHQAHPGRRHLGVRGADLGVLPTDVW